jgi:hypothetical protein
MAIIAEKLAADSLIPKQMANNVVSSVNNVFPDPDTGNVDLGIIPTSIAPTFTCTWGSLSYLSNSGNITTSLTDPVITITGTPIRNNAYTFALNKITSDIEKFDLGNGEVKGVVFSHGNLAHLQINRMRTEYFQITYPFQCGLVQLVSPYFLSNASGATSVLITSCPSATMHLGGISFQEAQPTRTIFDFQWGGYIYLQTGMPFTAAAGVKYVNFKFPGTLIINGAWTGFNASNITGQGTVIVNGVQYMPTMAV